MTDDPVPGLNITPLMAIAMGRHEMFKAYQYAGFTEAQAVTMIMGELAVEKAIEAERKEQERRMREGE